MMIKICGITQEADALAAAEAGATALGFNFYRRSPRYIEPEVAAAIGRGLPLLRVGVFVDVPPAEILAIKAVAALDVVQLHGTEQPATSPGGRIWKAFRIDAKWKPAECDAWTQAEAILLDGPTPGTGAAFDWRLARNLNQRIILAGGLSPVNVAAAVAAVRPWGVDACSRLESAPGVKDHSLIRQFVTAALAVKQ
jgi:phosphoribosylanthranilate isomerase